MNIDLLIKKATLEKNNPAKEAYRAIKAELLLNNSSKKPKPEGKLINSVIIKVDNEDQTINISELDLGIIKKQIQIREEQVSMYEANNRKELAEEYTNQIQYLKELLPPEVSRERIEETVVTAYPNGFTQKEMSKVIKEVKAIYPTADGKLISEVVKQHIA